MLVIEDAARDPDLIGVLARQLHDGFRLHWPRAWPTLEDARAEVEEALDPGRICRVAYEDAAPVGWIGGLPRYGSNVWELHPLVVAPERQGRGIGRALVADFEAQIAARGGLVVIVGTDDEDDMTNLGGIDLFPDLLAHLAAIEDRRRHPFGFYRRLGYSLAGIVPDAGGFGKPDIIMAKRVPPR